MNDSCGQKLKLSNHYETADPRLRTTYVDNPHNVVHCYPQIIGYHITYNIHIIMQRESGDIRAFYKIIKTGNIM